MRYLASTDELLGLVSLPQMVASSTMDAESVGLVRDYVNELLTCVVLPFCFNYLLMAGEDL